MAGTVNAPKNDPGYMKRLMAYLYNTEAAGGVKGQGIMDFYKQQNNADIPIVDGKINLEDPLIAQAANTANAAQNAALEHPFSTSVDFSSGGQDYNINGLKNTGSILWSNVKAHPLATIGTAANLGTNVAGLFDNDQFLGQLAGYGLGALGNHMLFNNVNPVGQANIMMAAGALGSLFDKLLAKKKAESQNYGYQQY